MRNPKGMALASGGISPSQRVDAVSPSVKVSPSYVTWVTLAFLILSGSFTREGSSRYMTDRTTNECVTTSTLPPPAASACWPASLKKLSRRAFTWSKRSARPVSSWSASTSAT